MDGAQFKKIVEYYGEENIISIGFDNSAAITFLGNMEPFSLSTYYIDEIECLMFTQWDFRGNPMHTIKHVENIQSIVAKEAGVPREKYDPNTIRG